MISGSKLKNNGQDPDIYSQPSAMYKIILHVTWILRFVVTYTKIVYVFRIETSFVKVNYEKKIQKTIYFGKNQAMKL